MRRQIDQNSIVLQFAAAKGHREAENVQSGCRRSGILGAESRRRGLPSAIARNLLKINHSNPKAASFGYAIIEG
jgi:hypothetical protein